MREPVALSVGIPTFNQATFIEQTLDSLLRQTQPAYEIVVSDNHCTDATPEILGRFGDRIRVVRPPRHLPMGESWSFLVEQLRGTWLSLLSSDDLALPRFVETLTRMAGQSERAVLVGGGYRVIDAAGRPLKDKHFRGSPPECDYPETLRAQLRGPRTSFAAFAARTEAVRAAGGFPAYQMTSDWGLWLHLAPRGSFLSTSEIFSEYRQGHHSREVERARLPLWIKDETDIYTRLLPELIATHGGVRPEEVQAASHARCRARLALASQLFDPSEREEIASSLATWARTAGLEAELEALRRGEAVRRSDRGALRGALRELGRDLRTRLGLRRRAYSSPETPPP